MDPLAPPPQAGSQPQQLQFSEEDMALLAQLANDPELLAQLSGDLDMGNALRNYQADPTVSAGRAVVPNYGGLIGAMFTRGQGRAQAEKAEQRMYDVLDRQNQTREAALRKAAGLPDAIDVPRPAKINYDEGNWLVRTLRRGLE
jgi:hypothetical protein